MQVVLRIELMTSEVRAAPRAGITMSVLNAIPTNEREAVLRHALPRRPKWSCEIVVFDDASPSLNAERLAPDAGLAVVCDPRPQRFGASGTICHGLDFRPDSERQMQAILATYEI